MSTVLSALSLKCWGFRMYILVRVSLSSRTAKKLDVTVSLFTRSAGITDKMTSACKPFLYRSSCPPKQNNKMDGLNFSMKGPLPVQTRHSWIISNFCILIRNSQLLSLLWENVKSCSYFTCRWHLGGAKNLMHKNVSRWDLRLTWCVVHVTL